MWGDTTDYMFNNFTGPGVGGQYPSTMVIDLDTMTLTWFQLASVEDAEGAIQQILDAPHPCADL